LLNRHQQAYRSGRSTEDILLMLTLNDILDAGNSMCAAFLGFQKAGSIRYYLLLEKLYNLNINPDVLL